MSLLRKAKGRNKYEARFRLPDGKLTTMNLSENRRESESILTTIESIVSRKKQGLAPLPEDSQWLRDIQGTAIHERLVKRGLADEGPAKQEIPSLREHIDAYMLDLAVKETTREQFDIAFNEAVTFLGNKPIDQFSERDAKQFAAWLKRKKLAEATIRKRLQRVKSLFTDAVKAGMISSNPFDGIKTTMKANTSLQRPVPADTVRDIISKLECPDAKMVLALCRFGGFRYSETALTRWDDIDWESGWITVRSSKTGNRQCPLFSTLRPYLEEVPLERRRGALQKRWQPDANARTTLKKMIRKTGHEPWDKVTHILRKSRATELIESLPPQTVAAYLGHSLRVLLEWYALQSDANAEKAMREL